MHIHNPKIFFLSFSILLSLLSNQGVSIAQINPDETLPVNSTVTPQGNIQLIEGGTQAGNNLFHSFKFFSIPSENTAYFNNNLDVRNIITRVTGGSVSNIDGIIKANGNASLFIINPAGIVFGPNASLNIGGSFVASTADSIIFADGSSFSANVNQASQLLTISVPIGLQFGSNAAGKIVNQSQASPDGEVTDANPPNPIGLKVPIGKTLALVGGDVALEGGNLTTTGGRIELASIAGAGLVKLTEIEKGYALEYSDIQNFGNIILSQGAIIYGSGENGGDIYLKGNNLSLTNSSLIFSSSLDATRGGNVVIDGRKINADEGSFIATFALAAGDAGDIILKASDSVEITGTTLDDQFPTAVVSQVLEQATGKGGNIIIETNQLRIQDGAIVDASTFGTGSAGNVIINAKDSVELLGSSDVPFASGISAQVADIETDEAGNAGNVSIETKRLVVSNGAQILTAARRSGNGGSLVINASDSILLTGASPFATGLIDDKQRSGIFVSAESEATGDVGNLNLNTETLTVENGARISADNFGSGQGTTQNINVRQLLIRNGGEVRSGSFATGEGGTLNVNATESVNVIGTGTINSQPVVSTLFSQAQASGKAGNLNINTPELNVQDGAEITVSAKGTGTAGNLTITSNTIRLNRGNLTAETNFGEGANITLQNIDLLILRNQSLISATAFNNADGGNINIDASKGFIAAIPNENSDITANAFAGKGGNVNISTQAIFGIEPRPQQTNQSDITASSELGLQGQITITQPQVQPPQKLIELPSGLVDASTKFAQICPNGRNAKPLGSFVITGRGSLPPNSFEPLTGTTSLSPLASLDGESFTNVSHVSPTANLSQTSRIVEAQGWVKTADGKIMLVAEAPTATPAATSSSAVCPGS
ncbi:filamentous hemagglutinin family outer membrane protein [Tolypothrix tenuis PCC 7101]|uniref:Filamentous hemagglutinin family outer membrane protein n=1 Tax=Tolypothrix tenuis PCC 7101 TaxID=231146 RepID=A0A1Z4N3S4_9CYAN|nr:filamentous hemagglutinin N-terminal domain-containing protein [Aulosira sp. FACHB-113]BAZ00302.1 filamentous hemagglutinin family outer membrane protein [Tolypothrix tenuis PCC 7101]BAZ75777.1 filamentous hemagglutinin family outer membrane protein [Aulosira laxa NIES-50]